MEKITLPEIGDGITNGVVISIQKKINQEINEGDILIEVETDKAAFPVNSPFSGKIKKILVQEGQKIKIGTEIAEIETGKATETEPEKEEMTPKISTTQEKEKSSPANKISALIEEDKTNNNQNPSPISNATLAPKSNNQNTHAGPATRKLARELGVNLNLVIGTARGGRIVIDDLKSFVKQNMNSSSPFSEGEVTQVEPELPDFTKFGETEVKPTSNLRNTIAKRISFSYQTIPHVHQFGEINLTNIDRYQKEFASEFKEKNSSLSVTVFIIKALSIALNKFPKFNSSYDSQKNAIHYKKYFHIGVAVDTPSGLIVPVIKNVNNLNLFEIGKNLISLAKQTHERTVKLENLKGACMTLSNLGGIGGSYFNPIINWPEVAILGVGRSVLKPVYKHGEWFPKNMMPFVLAYDHRIIDGADGVRFAMYLKETLEKPEKFLIGLE